MSAYLHAGSHARPQTHTYQSYGGAILGQKFYISKMNSILLLSCEIQWHKNDMSCYLKVTLILLFIIIIKIIITMSQNAYIKGIKDVFVLFLKNCNYQRRKKTTKQYNIDSGIKDQEE